MHWGWKNCPTAWTGQFKGKEKGPTIVLEAVATKDAWIWHVFFGTSGSLNDINVLERAPLFQSSIDGTGWTVQFQVQGNTYTNGYYLVDGIYPSWSNLIESKGHSSNQATKHFTKRQESIRKDIERAFGVLKSQFQIISNPALQWYPWDLSSIMKTCIILHNMLVEYQTTPKDYDFPDCFTLIPPHSSPYSLCNQHIQSIEIKSAAVHDRLLADLIAHHWAFTGKGNKPSNSDLSNSSDSDLSNSSSSDE